MPSIKIILNVWTFHQFPYATEAVDWEKIASKIKKHGVNAINWPPRLNPNIGKWVESHGFEFGGAFDYGSGDDAEALIAANLEVGDGPINCQLGDHNTPTEEAVDLCIEVMEASEKLGADVHIEAHRDTATETPEKMDAIIDGYFAKTGKRLKVNFDYSHPSIIKHLLPQDYSNRLLTRPDYLQESTLVHMRPFNGHHCQIPVTDGQGNLSFEFKNYLPFAKDVFACWLKKNGDTDKTLWVMPELGPFDLLGYGLSCFPDVTEDVFVLADELRKVWDETLSETLFTK